MRSSFLFIAGGAAALLVLLFLAPHAAAAAPPQAVVLQANSSTPAANPPGSYQVFYNLTWRVSPDDPDQINGSLNYVIWYNTTNVPSGWLIVYNNTNPDKVPLHPGWFKTQFSLQGPRLEYGLESGTFLSRNVTLNMTVWNASDSTMSLESCSVRGFDAPNYYSTAGGSDLTNVHDQCGLQSFIQDPPGVSARVNIPSTTGNSSTQIRWNISIADLNQTAGNLTYRVFVSTPDYNVTRPGANLGADPTGADDASAIRQFWFNTSGRQPAQLLIQIRAEDPLSFQWSNLSCAVSVHTDRIYEETTCGLMGNSAGATVGGPTFPLIADVPGLASNMGLSTDALGWILAGVFLFAVMGGGFWAAGLVGAFAAGSLGVACVALMGLIPLWFVVVVFLVAAVVVFLMSGGGGGG